MPRPPEHERVHKLVEADLAAAEAALPPGSIPVNLFAVSSRTHVHRGTLRRYGLDVVIRQAAQRMVAHAKGVPSRQRELAEQLRGRDDEILTLKRANELLLARVALAEANAQRLGIDPMELWRPVAAPPRTVPYTPGGRRPSLKTLAAGIVQG
jgi:hypothetical protein